MFSLIVGSVDRFDQLARLCRSLAGQSCRAFEMVLVDQNPDDRLVPVVAEFSAAFPIRHIRAPKGLSLARNRGIAASRGSLVAFPDDDCWYRPETLGRVLSKFEANPDLACVTGRTLDAFDQPSLSPSGDVELTIDRDNYLQCGNSNSIFVRRSLLASIGGFDERLGVGAQTPFQSGEEADLLLRAIAHGSRLRYFPDIVVHHDQVDQQITATHAVRAAKYGRGFGALLRKHGYGRAYLLYRLARPLASFGVATLRGKRDLARYKWAWLTGIAEGYRTWSRIAAGLPADTSALPVPDAARPAAAATSRPAA